MATWHWILGGGIVAYLISRKTTAAPAGAAAVVKSTNAVPSTADVLAAEQEMTLALSEKGRNVTIKCDITNEGYAFRGSDGNVYAQGTTLDAAWDNFDTTWQQD